MGIPVTWSGRVQTCIALDNLCINAIESSYKCDAPLLWLVSHVYSSYPPVPAPEANAES